MKILVTGFDPFGGDSVNPALELIKQLPAEIDGCEIITQEVPTVFHKSIQVIKDIRTNRPCSGFLWLQAHPFSHASIPLVAFPVQWHI